MRHPHVLILSLVLGTLALALVLGTSLRSDPSGEPAALAASMEPPRGTSSVLEEIARDLALPEPPGAPAPSRASALAPRGAGEGDAGSDEPPAGPEVSAEAAPPTREELFEFREFVAQTLAEVRTEEAQKKRRALDGRRARMDATMADLERSLRLSPEQSDRLRTALLARLDREGEYVWLWENGAEEQALAELEKGDAEAWRRELGAFLSADQLARLPNP